MDFHRETSPAGSIAAAVRKHRASAVSVAEAVLARIDAGAPLRAFVHVDADAMLQEAAVVDARLAAGEDLPLAGVPFGVKDVLAVAGRPVTHGSRLHADHVPDVDAVAVARLRKAGAVVAGMTATSEFACKGVTSTPLHGATRHPLDPTLTPGGSSGGSAVAVAAGLVPFALGTDSGGSARRPAAHCGIVGFKPSYGAVPNGPGLPGASVGIGCVAPMTRSVADAATVFAALAGPDPSDPDSLVALWPEDRPPASLRITSTVHWGLHRPVDDRVAAGVSAACDRLRAAGVRIVARDPIWPSGVDEGALMPLQHALLATHYGDAFRRDPDLFDPAIAVQIERGLGLSGTDVARALMVSQSLKAAAAALFADADLVVGPTVPCVAWPLDRLGPATIGGLPAEPRAHAAFTPFFNHGGNPAISIPVPTRAPDLPFGLQIVGPRGRDACVLAFAAFCETALAGHPS